MHKFHFRNKYICIYLYNKYCNFSRKIFLSYLTKITDRFCTWFLLILILPKKGKHVCIHSRLIYLSQPPEGLRGKNFKKVVANLRQESVCTPPICHLTCSSLAFYYVPYVNMIWQRHKTVCYIVYIVDKVFAYVLMINWNTIFDIWNLFQFIY